MSITRRIFLRHTAAAGAAVAVTAPAVAAEPEMSPRDQAIWHLRELERLLREDGGTAVTVMAVATYGNDAKLIGIQHTRRLIDRDGMFASDTKGGPRNA
ncbi:twin-arginine translocation signal domain-containing protein [Mesorhizobium sp. PUT5]|uniref:twin-arginine translocation signal domain-containing protein n=1 Tax=Mesorhizobium sp. PUT5 TaxID=3454629 RepID=UPI003FA49C6E